MERQSLRAFSFQLRHQVLPRSGYISPAVTSGIRYQASKPSQQRKATARSRPIRVSGAGSCRQPLYKNVARHHFSTEAKPSEPASKAYSFEEIRALASHPDPRRLIIDVREPAELQETGRVPGAASMPISSNPDAFYLNAEDFHDRFGFEKPHARPAAAGHDKAPEATRQQKSPYTKEMKRTEAAAGINSDDAAGAQTGEVEEVIFYCKAGVRSRTAAKMAGEWAGLKIGDMTGGWNEWHAKGGPVERE